MTNPTKTKRLAVPALILSAAVALLTPTAAMAAPFNPDGSAPYGPDTICQVTDAYDPTVGDNTDTTCSPIPTVAWDNSTVPTATFTDYPATAAWENLEWVSSVVNEGSAVSGVDGDEDPAFIVRPTSPETLPLLATATLSTFNSGPAQTSVKAYFVPDNTVINFIEGGDPYDEITNGERVAVSGTTAQELTLTPTGEDTYAVDLTIPTPTWKWVTDGTLNGYGYAGRLVTVVETTVGGEPATLTNTIGLSFHSAHLLDINDFLMEEFLPDGSTIGVVGAQYDILPPHFPIFIEEPPVVEPPVVEPPVVEPPVVEPPVVEPPVVGPKVNSGADFSTNPLTAWLPVGLGALLLAGMFVPLAIAKKREMEVTE